MAQRLGTRARTAPARRASSALLAALVVLLSCSLGTLGAHAATGDGATTKGIVDADGKALPGSITVSRTTDLRNEVVQVSWKGLRPTIDAGGDEKSLDADGDLFGKPSTRLLDNRSARVVHVMQCATTDPTREQCLTLTRQSGVLSDEAVSCGSAGCDDVYDGREEDDRFGPGAAKDRGAADLADVPFTSRTGKSYDSAHIPDVSDASDSSLRAATRADGTGEVNFEVRTTTEAPSLGCSATTACSLVVIPEDRPIDRYAPSPLPKDFRGEAYDALRQFRSMSTVPFSASNWARRVVFPLTFSAGTANCPLGDQEENSYGNELSAELITRWQPALCGSASGVTLAHTVLGTRAAAQLSLGQSDLVLTQSSPAAAPARAPRLAPVSISGVGFAWLDDKAPPGTVLKLTPRLVAKLLTESYGTPEDPNTPHAYRKISLDPEFAALNTVGIAGRPQVLLSSQADPTLVADQSDAIAGLWAWVLADPDAAAWLGGTPDAGGMTVNAQWKGYGGGTSFEHRDGWQCGKAQCLPLINASGGEVSDAKLAAFLATTTYHVQTAATASAIDTGLASAIRGRGLSNNGLFLIAGTQLTWKPAADQVSAIGDRHTLAWADTATAARFGVQMAALKNSAGQFVVPNASGLQHAIDGATHDAATGLWSVPPTSTDPLAYPLTAVTHAEVPTAGLSPDAAARVATVLDRAAGPGQVPGPQAGGLPDGYLPLTQAMKDQTAEVAQEVRTQAGNPAPVAASTPVATTAPLVAAPAPAATSAATAPRASTPAATAPAAAPAATAPSATPKPSATSSASPSPKPSTKPSAKPSASPSPTASPKPSASRSSSTGSGSSGGSVSGGNGSTTPFAGPTLNGVRPFGSATGSATAPASSTASPGATAEATPSAPVATPKTVPVARSVPTAAETAGPMRWALVVTLALGLLGALARPVLAAQASGRTLGSMALARVRRSP